MDLREGVKLYLKGMAMGAADVVPGVSGGTIAFISGIYEELLRSIKSIGPQTITVLHSRGLKAAWQQINGSFLLTLVAGIISSVALLVRPITWLLKEQPVLIWSFFFGLIAASVWMCGRKVHTWSIGPIAGGVIGTGAALAVGMSQSAGGSETLPFFFMAGAIAICAMILPGISGSFILLLMGAYGPVMAAIKGFDVPVIAVFGAGCMVGLMAFSRVLSWMYLRHHDLTISTLTGFLLGSLYIIWPWKEVLSVRTVHVGRPDERLEPFLRGNVMPGEYEVINEFDAMLGVVTKDPQVIGAVALMLGGAFLLLWMDRLGPDAR